ncbi:hypothetical protein TELCIR_24135 [Teladorsagia circumcincta]|uniref:Uncharacterized protein n=1 Tax=Teladorsagia circumcincta TaxID=45464 RepID=A0A2G9T954_TELCI|nr:hypothetical protein TELCIR_24135 [Teladorsagia circumcincta]
MTDLECMLGVPTPPDDFLSRSGCDEGYYTSTGSAGNMKHFLNMANSFSKSLQERISYRFLKKHLAFLDDPLGWSHFDRSGHIGIRRCSPSRPSRVFRPFSYFSI